MVDYNSTTDSSVDSESREGSESESTLRSDSPSLAGSILGTLVGSESAHSVTEECFQPAIFQLAEGNFKHFAHSPHSMYTMHEGTPSNNS